MDRATGSLSLVPRARNTMVSGAAVSGVHRSVGAKIDAGDEAAASFVRAEILIPDAAFPF